MRSKLRFARFASTITLTIAAFALIAIAASVYHLRDATDGLRIVTDRVGDTPITIFRPQSSAPSPVVIIAHGFAGSQQLMQPFAVTLARNGYTAITFDFLGHGRNPAPMRGDVTDGTTITNALLREIGEVAAYARRMPGTDGRLAALGHSMASDIVVRFAQANPDVQATVAVSVFSPVATAASPRNLLVIVGAVEPAMLINEGLRIVNLTAGGSAAKDVTYGAFGDGTARRLVLARGVEHIGVLYSPDSLRGALGWMNAAFGRESAGFLDHRGLWHALLFAGILALAWPLSQLLPRVTETPRRAGVGWRVLLIAAIAPALLTPLILWKLPTDFLPVLLGDYLALHFALYGAMTAAICGVLRKPALDGPPIQSAWPRIVLAALAVGAFNIVAFGSALDAYVFSFWPISARWPLMAVIACGTIPYFLADEWLTRGASARRGAYALTKFCFLLSLAIAVLLNPAKLFFLAIIVPAILLLFLIFGLISRWSFARTAHPFPGALANAAMFAWTIAVIFPMVVRQ